MSAFEGKADMTIFALHMSAFEGKADMTICGMSAFAVAIGCKADMACCGASASDPKRTSARFAPVLHRRV